MTKKAFTLYLAKDQVQEFDDLLSEGGRTKLADPTTQQIDTPNFCDGAKLYVFVGQQKTPTWLRDLRQTFNIGGRIETKSVCALLMYRSSQRMFACSFSHGWMYLEEDLLEADFGLRVAINAVDEGKLNRLDRANLGDALRAVSHSPFQRDFKSFGLDDALDLVRKVSGTTKLEASADAMVGSKSLKISGELDLDELGPLSDEALTYFNATDYQNTGFAVLDMVSPVADGQLVQLLDQLVVESVQGGLDEFELGLPVTYDDDSVSYRFIGPNHRGRYPDLLLRNYTAALGDRLATLTAQMMKDHKIGAWFDDTRPERKWSIRSSLIGSLVHDDGRYAINEGEWYRVDEAFKQSIEQSFTAMVTEWAVPPVPLRKVYDEDGNGVYQREETYNQERAAELGYVLLDQQSVRIPGIPRSGYEPCDLLDIAGKRLIHVKKSSRRSNVLSHFFKQGGNSGQQFKRFPAAWTGLYQLVRERAGDAQADQLIAANEQDDRDWTVEFWIADTARADGTFNIPFFSKITLRDEASNLVAMNYRVELKFIGLQAD